ncbi:MAG: hypothetical protein Q9214_002912 [Letrouitia sp. 1 TL-2023]
MPSAKASVLHNRKRQLSEAEPETDLSPQPTTKRQKLEGYRRQRTPSSFWDNLSRQWLTRRTLREFNRRTVWPATSVPPHRTGKENINLAKLRRFARHGGPSLSDIRGYPDPDASIPSNLTMDSGQSGSRKRAKTRRESGTSTSTKRTSAYDPPFEQHLIDHGIYPEGYGGVRNLQEPHNLEEINTRLALPRASLSPSRFTREDFLDFKEKNQEALTEMKVMSKAFPIIAGTADIPSQENLRFTNLEDLTDGSITKAQPDFYDGARPAELNKQIREELGPYIVPSTNTTAPCLPNFFTEGKGPKGLIDLSKNQAMYDGALGARGIHKLRLYVDPETAYDNNAYTITSTYHPSGLLTMYTSHPVESTNPKHQTEYRMNQLRSFAMTDAPDTFRQGAAALRNGRDWTRDQRKELIDYTSHPVESTNPKHQTEYRMTQLNSYAMTGNPDSFRQGAAAWRNGRDLTRDQRKKLIVAANAKALNTETPGFESSTQSFISLSSDELTRPESETSADELAMDLDMSQSTNHTTPVQARAKVPHKESSNRRVKKVYQAKKKVGTDLPV